MHPRRRPPPSGTIPCVVRAPPPSPTATVTAGGRDVTVDATDHVLRVHVDGQGWELGASRAGVAAALALCRDARRPSSLWSDDAHPLHPVVVGCLRSAASAVGAVDPALEQQLQLLRATPLLYAAPFLAARHLQDDAARFRPCRIAIARVEPDDDGDATPEGAEALVERLARWRDLFAPDGRARRALNATLQDHGDAASADALWGLRRVPLSGRAASRDHVEVLGALGNHPRAEQLLPQLAAVEAASVDALREAMGLLGRCRGFGVHHALGAPHALAELLALARPEPGERPGLADLVRDATGIASHGLPLSGRTALPPIPLPALPGVRFLATVREILDEGVRMGHCVGGRRLDAIRGEAYLFHVDGGGGDLATVQVARTGRVVEASGPANRQNGAARSGRRALARWGLGFWAARLGLQRPTWGPGFPVPPGAAPLATVADVYGLYLVAAGRAPDDDAVAPWFERAARRAVAGEVGLVRLPDGGLGVVDPRGQVVSCRRAHGTVVEVGTPAGGPGPP